MARFYDALTENIDFGSAAELDNPFGGGGTCFNWAKLTPSPATGTRMMSKRNTVGYQFALVVDSGDEFGMNTFWDYVNNGIWNSTDNFYTAGDWGNFSMEKNSSNLSDPKFWSEGNLTGVNESNTPSGSYDGDSASNMQLGNLQRNNAAAFSGDLCEFTYWSTTLSDAKHSALGRGVNPFIMDNESLIIYSPIWGNDDPEPDYTGKGNTGAVTGATKSNSHAPVELLENYL